MQHMGLQLFVRLLPPSVAVLALCFGGQHVDIPATSQNILISTALGFSVSLLLSVFKMERTTDKTAKEITKAASFNICIVTDKDEIEAIVKGLYQTEGGVVYSIGMNYTAEESTPGDVRETDWASQLYSRREAKTVFNRLIPVNGDQNGEWVVGMLKAKKTPNYDLRVAEGVVNSSILFPNFVIVRKNEGYRLFMSFRTSSAPGRFAFVTQDRRFAEGIWQYAVRLHSSFNRAEDLVARWGKEIREESHAG